MNLLNTPWLGEAEELIAELSDAAYRVLLQRGLPGSFLEVELELWRALRAVFQRQLAASALDQAPLAEAVSW